MAHKQEDASTMAGYKDKLVGGVKKTVGNLLGIEQMEKAGQKQKQKGEAELRAAMEQQRAIGERERKHKRKAHRKAESDESYELVRREAVLSELCRGGGFERRRTHLKHVEVKEPDVRRLFDRSQPALRFQLKRRDIRPLLEEIRERRTRRPLLHVETKEKGLMHSIRLGRDDFQLKRRGDTFNRLLSDIRRADNLDRLKKVNRSNIRDRSAPRLDLFKGLKAIHQQHDVLLREVMAPPHLKHVETKDKTKPSLFFDKSVRVHRIEKDKLLNEVRQGLDKTHHVETNDRSGPIIERDLHIKKLDRKGFLEEVHKGAHLKHI